MMPVAEATKKVRWWLWSTLIWVALFAMDVWIYARLVDTPTMAGVVTILCACIVVVVVVGSISTWFTRRRWRRESAEFDDACGALARGHLQQAHDAFARCCESNNRLLSAIARHNLGWTLMRLGRLEDALAVVSNNDDAHANELGHLSMYATSSADLALVSALLGKVEDAGSWLATTDQRAAVRSNPSLPAMRVFSYVVLACRQDRGDEAARMLDERWAECEASLTGADLRPLRVVRGFVHAATGPRNAGVAESFLASCQPAYDREFDFLGVAWPEMKTFLVAHRLVRCPPA